MCLVLYRTVPGTTTVLVDIDVRLHSLDYSINMKMVKSYKWFYIITVVVW